MPRAFRFCNDTYTRGEDGVWRYPWGAPVPGAIDLTVADLLQIDPSASLDPDGFRELCPEEQEWLAGRRADVDQVLVRRRGGQRPDVGDLIIGMHAPELHPLAMLTVGDIAEAAGVSKATIDSYRYRGSLPPPQVVRGRTPLWARPIVNHWLANRPGPGWRTDLYTTEVPPAPRRIPA